MPVRRYYKLPPPDPEEEARKQDMCCDGCMELPLAVQYLSTFGIAFYTLGFFFSFFGRANDLFPGEGYYFALIIMGPIHVAFYVISLNVVLNNGKKTYIVPNLVLQVTLAVSIFIFTMYLCFKHKPDSNLVALGHGESVRQVATIALMLFYFSMKVWNMIVLIKYYDYLIRKEKLCAIE